MGLLALLPGAKQILGARGLTTRSKEARLLALLPGARKILGAPGLTTRSNEDTRGSWPY